MLSGKEWVKGLVRRYRSFPLISDKLNTVGGRKKMILDETPKICSADMFLFTEHEF
jgi:hypothetical protein